MNTILAGKRQDKGLDQMVSKYCAFPTNNQFLLSIIIYSITVQWETASNDSIREWAVRINSEPIQTVVLTCMTES